MKGRSRTLEGVTTQKDGHLTVEGGQLYYGVYGQGDTPIVWMHGMPLNADSWYAQLLQFDAHFKNVVFDLRGYHRSSKLPPDVKSVTDLYVEDLRCLLNALNLDRPTLVAHASGAHGALRFAATHPEQLDKLVVINGSPRFVEGVDWEGFSEETCRDFIERIDSARDANEVAHILFEPALREESDQISTIRDWYTSMIPLAGKETIKAFFSNVAYDADRALMTKITARTLIIASQLGAEVPFKTSLFLRQHIRHSKLVEINDIDHFAFGTKQGLINDLIEQFVRPSCDISIPPNSDTSG